jgi:hypothetical protein
MAPLPAIGEGKAMPSQRGVQDTDRLRPGTMQGQ